MKKKVNKKEFENFSLELKELIEKSHKNQS